MPRLFQFGADGSLPCGIVAVGAAFGTSKAGIGISGVGAFKPELIMKVKEARTVKLVDADSRFAAVADSCRDVWDYCSIWAGSIGVNSRESCVQIPSTLINSCGSNIVFSGV